VTKNDSDTVRVGLVGYGLGGSTFHAPLVAAAPGLELVAIVTGNPERAERARARYPTARVVANVDDLWTIAPPLDLVVVSTPHATHAPIASAALAHGSHVVVDKPFAMTSDEARELAAEA
jgi:predicted dehydrogenase